MRLDGSPMHGRSRVESSLRSVSENPTVMAENIELVREIRRVDMKIKRLLG
jgi:hypothetical protein